MKMKTNRLLMFAVLSLAPLISASALASTSFTCTEDASHSDENSRYEFTLSEGKVSVENTFTHQKFTGSYTSKRQTRTRIAGADQIDLEANYFLPDYGRPHTVSARLLSNIVDSEINSISGYVYVRSLLGRVIKEFGVKCTLNGAVK